MSDFSGGYYRAEGLDVPAVLRHALDHKGSLAGYDGAQSITNEELLRWTWTC